MTVLKPSATCSRADENDESPHTARLQKQFPQARNLTGRRVDYLCARRWRRGVPREQLMTRVINRSSARLLHGAQFLGGLGGIPVAKGRALSGSPPFGGEPGSPLPRIPTSGRVLGHRSPYRSGRVVESQPPTADRQVPSRAVPLLGTGRVSRACPQSPGRGRGFSVVRNDYGPLRCLAQDEPGQDALNRPYRP
jgi:hypothetical protein